MKVKFKGRDLELSTVESYGSDPKHRDHKDAKKFLKKFNERKPKKRQTQAQSSIDSIQEWSRGGWIDDEVLQHALGHALKSLKYSLPEECDYIEADTLEGEDLRETLGEVLSYDPEYAKELRVELIEEVETKKEDRFYEALEEEGERISGPLNKLKGLFKSDIEKMDEKELKAIEKKKNEVFKTYKENMKLTYDELKKEMGEDSASEYWEEFYDKSFEKMEDSDWEFYLFKNLPRKIDLSKVTEKLKEYKKASPIKKASSTLKNIVKEVEDLKKEL